MLIACLATIMLSAPRFAVAQPADADETWVDKSPIVALAESSLVARVTIVRAAAGVADGGWVCRVDGVVTETGAVSPPMSTIRLVDAARWQTDGTLREPEPDEVYYGLLSELERDDDDDADGEGEGDAALPAYSLPSATLGLYRVRRGTVREVDPDSGEVRETVGDVVWSSLRNSWPLFPVPVADYERWLRLGLARARMQPIDAAAEAEPVVRRLRRTPIVPSVDEQIAIVTEQTYCLEVLAIVGTPENVRDVARYSLSLISHVDYSVARALATCARGADDDSFALALDGLMRLARAVDVPAVTAEALLALERLTRDRRAPEVVDALLRIIPSLIADDLLAHARVDPERQPPCPARNTLPAPMATAYRVVVNALGTDASTLTPAERTARQAGIEQLRNERFAVAEAQEAALALPALLELDRDLALAALADRLRNGDDTRALEWTSKLSLAIAAATARPFGTAAEFLDWYDEQR